MYCNSFTGTLSALISPKLETADLHHNSFTGKLPAFLHCASTLTYVSLANNELTGTVPASWKALSKLETVGLAYNKLSGSIDWLITKAVLPGMQSSRYTTVRSSASIMVELHSLCTAVL
jgi:hypothetical protein